MRLAPALLVVVTALALVGAAPARCLAGMPDAAPVEAPATPPCHEAPPDAPRPPLPVGTAAACCALPATAPDAPAPVLSPEEALAATRPAVEVARLHDAPGVRPEAQPPDRLPGPLRALIGCFRI